MRKKFSAAHNPSPHPAKKGESTLPPIRVFLVRGVVSRPAAAPISRARSRFTSRRRAKVHPLQSRRGPSPSALAPWQPRRILGSVPFSQRPALTPMDSATTGARPSAATGPGPNPTIGARPSAATPAPRTLQRPPPPPSQQELRCRRHGHHMLADVAQKTCRRKMSASTATKNTPPPLYELPTAATISNNDLDASMESEQSFMDMIGTVDIDDMTVPLSFGSVNEDPIDTTVPMSAGNVNEDPIENNPLKRKKWARSANYSIEEDEALVMAWESVSLDPIIGTDQNTSTYWNRIYDHFHRNVKTPSSRTLGSLAHRWSTIQECCNRWAGCVEQIDRAPPSGATIQDRTKYCQQLYTERDPKKKTFVMPHCWSLLQNNEKWKKRNTDSNPLHKKSSSCSLGSMQGNEEDEEETASLTAMPANKRPPGRKQEKERVKGGDHVVFQSAVQEIIASMKEVEAGKKQDKESRWLEMKDLEERKVKIEEKKLDRKQLKQECKIMFMETSGLDEKQKAFVETMRTQILVSKMGENWSGAENSSA